MHLKSLPAQLIGYAVNHDRILTLILYALVLRVLRKRTTTAHPEKETHPSTCSRRGTTIKNVSIRHMTYNGLTLRRQVRVVPRVIIGIQWNLFFNEFKDSTRCSGVVGVHRLQVLHFLLSFAAAAMIEYSSILFGLLHRMIKLRVARPTR